MKKLILLLIIFSAVIFCTKKALLGNNEVYVTRVIDGDTFESKGQRFRLSEIDAPEHDQTFGEESKNYLSSLILHKNIKVDVVGTDKYGRKIVLIYLNNENINLIMVQGGYAWWYRYYSHDKNLEEAEAQARKNKKGLWKFSAENPYDFRKRTKK